MIVSLSIDLVICFKGHLFIVAYIFLIARIWASVQMEQFYTQWMDFHEIW